MGKLRQCYQLATVAFVGGTFVSHVGGHNLLEPCAYGVPVLFGPQTHAQLEMKHLINHYQAGLQVTKEVLGDALLTLLNDPSLCIEMGKRGQRIFKESSGATERSFNVLSKSLASK